MTVTTDTFLDRFHIVLVEPAESLNVGAVARAMANLGFGRLHLVAPRNYDRARARITACWAEPLLDRLLIHDRFEDAIAGVEAVVGLSEAREAGRAHRVTLPAWASGLTERSVGEMALVFGPEDSGLRQEHLDRCRWIVTIPSAAACPSFNLAQAVLLVLYEITRTLPDGTLLPVAPQAGLPTGNDYLQLERLLDSVMRDSGFLRNGTPAPVPGVVRSLFHRMPLDRREMGVLLGLFGKIDRTLRRNGPEKGR